MFDYLFNHPLMPAFLSKLWYGRYPLVKAFWLAYVLGWFLSYFVLAMCLVAIELVFLRMGVYQAGRLIAFWLIAVLWPLYMFVATVGAWRSATAYPYSRWWPNLAKGLILFYTAMFLYKAANGGVLRIMDMLTQ